MNTNGHKEDALFAKPLCLNSCLFVSIRGEI